MDPLLPSARVTDEIGLSLGTGAHLGRHVIDGWLREGGMAVLYRGHHIATHAKVAIKIQRPCEEDATTTAARFMREADVMGRLSSAPNVVRVLDVGSLPDGRAYLVMEWIEGENLEELLDGLRSTDSRMPIDRACRLVADVARALEAAHRVGVVHRDVKPSNVMVDRGLPDREVAKLLDFGISADLGAGARGEHLTAAGVVLGTSSHVAPEQALGLPADPGFDVYALGMVLFEAVTGHTLPPAELAPLRLPPLRELRAGVPPALEALVLRCTSRDPSARPSAGEVVAALEGIRGERAAGIAGVGVLVREAPKERSGGRAWWWAVAAVVLAAVAWWWWASRPSPEVSTPAAVDVAPESSEGTSTGAQDALVPPGPASDDSGSPATTGDASSGTSAGTTEEVAPGDGRTDDASDGASVRPLPAAGCRRARDDARAALDHRDWQEVIRASAARPCWSSAADRSERKAMRVKAFLELERWSSCVEEGRGAIDPHVARLTKHCRERLANAAGGGG